MAVVVVVVVVEGCSLSVGQRFEQLQKKVLFQECFQQSVLSCDLDPQQNREAVSF